LKLLLDAMLPSKLATPLREHGIDAEAIDGVQELTGLSDDRVIEWGRAENRVIVTRNVDHFCERARERVAALPTPPPSLQPIVTLLLRAFNQSLQANHAYIDWLRSGRAADDRGWRISLRASGTKAQLLNRLAKAGAPYGIRVPSATNFWP
jgi:predicted nuclease of predicted toxin-antitoxin system